MSDIFESLENLNVSEECFDEIMGIVEEILGESMFGNYSGRANVESVKQALRAKYNPKKATASDKYSLKDKLEQGMETPVDQTKGYAHSTSKHYKKKLKGANRELKKAQNNLQNANKESSSRLKKARAAQKVGRAEEKVRNLSYKKEMADNLLKTAQDLSNIKHSQYYDDGDGSAQVHRRLHEPLAKALKIRQV